MSAMKRLFTEWQESWATEEELRLPMVEQAFCFERFLQSVQDWNKTLEEIERIYRDDTDGRRFLAEDCSRDATTSDENSPPESKTLH